MDSDSDSFDGWEEDGDEVEAVTSLFAPLIFPTIKAAIEYDKVNFGFDIAEVARKLGSEMETVIMLVNYVRKSVKAELVAKGHISQHFATELLALVETKSFLDDISNMMAVLPDDSMLFALRGEIIGTDDHDDHKVAETVINHPQEPTVQELQHVVLKYKTLVDSLTECDSAIVPELPNDNYYFDSYSHIAIHETMLSDAPRTSAYADAMSRNAEVVRGKTVLDIGCGTGILSMFAARAGAAKVIGIDCSAIIDKARLIVEKNGFSDVITLIRGRLEEEEATMDLALGEGGKVDIIVSEWMGYGLYFENMLSSVLQARDKYLAPHGLLMPSHAQLFVQAMTARGDSDRVGWWSSVYGFDMTDLQAAVCCDAQVQVAHVEDLLSDRCLAHELDLGTAQDCDLDFQACFSMRTDKGDFLKAFVVSFDVLFKGSWLRDSSTVLCTAVGDPTTHWKQTVLWLRPENIRELSSNSSITGCLKYQRRVVNSREYTIDLAWSIGEEHFNQSFVLN